MLVTCEVGPKVWEEALSKQRKEEQAGLTLSPVPWLPELSCRLHNAISFPPSVPDPWAAGQLSSLSLVPGNQA